ncbi:rhodopsin-like GPCR transmembrane domain-containing protein [Pelagophyceae sp. CCMP2097]|nr:rhodopsin-like GPCR transmembrane domain-containing protein [Pelagophyceae sp. CCMP2097]|mmetsp:Transcript_20365/g.69029  ORF Transcript_20365/g.69029 Transcript_20365/m.69029 type:complete len:644 (+) Transcript_20365:132-2063(+)
MRASLRRLCVAAALGAAGGMQTNWKDTDSPAPWLFVERFCINAGSGATIKYEIDHYGGYLLVYHFDNVDSFAQLVDADLSDAPLLERVRDAQIQLKLVPNTKFDEARGGMVVNDLTRVEGELRADVSSPRFVFFVLSNYDLECGNSCSGLLNLEESGGSLTLKEQVLLDAVYGVDRNTSATPACATSTDAYCSGPIKMSYKFTLLNEGPKLLREFSFDESYLLPIAIFAAIFDTILLGCALVIRRMLVVARKLHHTARMLVEAVAFEWLSTLFRVAYYGQYAQDGKAPPTMLVISRILHALADIETVLLLVLLAKGWTVVRHKISGEGRMKLAVFTSTYMVAHIAAMVWATESYDAARVDFYYGTGPGTALVVLRLACVVWFLRASYTTAVQFQSKRGFFRKLRVVGALWLAAMPIAVGAARGSDAEYRNNTFALVDTLTFLAGHVVLVALYNPATRFNQGFPFHKLNTRDLGMLAKRTPTPVATFRRVTDPYEQSRHGNAPLVRAATPHVHAPLAAAVPRAAQSKVRLQDAVEAAHVRRVASIARALLDRVRQLEHVSVDLGDALSCVEVPPALHSTLAPPSPTGGRPRAAAMSGSPLRGAARPAKTPPARTLLDDAIDDELPDYSSARKRTTFEAQPRRAY